MRPKRGMKVAAIALLLAGGLLCATSCRRNSSYSAGDVKEPLVARVEVRQTGPTVMFYFHLADATGKEIRNLRLPNGRRPSPPRVAVLDARGRQAYSCTLAYG